MPRVIIPRLANLDAVIRGRENLYCLRSISPLNLLLRLQIDEPKGELSLFVRRHDEPDAAIQLGRDFGTQVEVVAGLDPKDQVVVNPPDSLVDGEEVRPVAESYDGTQPAGSAGNQPQGGNGAQQQSKEGQQ